MKFLAISFLSLAVLTIVACGVSKKSTKKTPATEHAASITSTTRIAPSVASSDGIFAPGSAELAAMQAAHKDMTAQSLMEGYKLYTGICTDCHKAKSIYDRPEAAWPGILTAMAKQARITDAQKEAIYEYVMSIKATQPR